MKQTSRAWITTAAVAVLILLLGGVYLYTQVISGVLVGYGASPVPDGAPLPIETLEIPAGFTIEQYARAEGARSLALGENGVVFVGSMAAGKVYALVPTDAGVETRIIDDNLERPNGIAYKDGDLYVVEPFRILVYRNIMRGSPDEPEVLFTDFPPEPDHEWRYVAFGPDGKLYIALGMPCNVCERPDPYGTIVRMDVKNPERGYEIVARGIRNSVGFDWDPKTKELWFTDNGRDWMGDDSPGDELNRVTVEGQHFGFPYCQQGNIQDPDVGSGRSCDEFKAPEQVLGPHVAALGMAFVPDSWPAQYQNAVLIAEHGSWNRADAIGYRVTLVTRTEDGTATGYEPFVSGFLTDEGAWGRPVAALVLEDDSVLISDDKAGAIYRIAQVQ